MHTQRGVLEFALTWDGGEIEDLLVTTSGVADPAGVAAYWQAIIDDDHLRPGLLILVDHRASTWTEMSSPEIQIQARAFGSNLERVQAEAIAAVMGSKVEFGLMRMLHGHTSHDAELELGVFETMEEARAWLAQHLRIAPDVSS